MQLNVVKLINMKKEEKDQVQDCVTQINGSMEQLCQAIKELCASSLMITSFDTVMSWVSTALADASYCVQYSPEQGRVRGQLL